MMQPKWARTCAWVAAGSLSLAGCGDESATNGAGSAGAGGSDPVDAGDDSGGQGGGADDGGDASDNPALNAKCTPTVTMQIEDTGPKGELFTQAVPDPVPFVQETGRMVCRILYRHPDEVRDANHITLIIRDDPDYPGWKMGDVGDITVMISTDHLADLDAQGHDLATEIRGILLHEMTHMYQHDDKAPGEGTYPDLLNVIEGVADFVRIRAGFTPIGAVATKGGAWDEEGYWKPAFFMLWIDMQYQDFLYQLNLSMVRGDGVAWTPDAIQTITGVHVDELWSQYQTADCCALRTHDCCH